MAITNDTLETEVETLVAAIEAESFVAARKSATKIQAYLIALPDYGIDGRNVRYGRTDIQKMLDSLDTLERTSSNSASATIVRTRWGRG